MTMMSKWVFLALIVSVVISMRNPKGETKPSASPSSSMDSWISIDFLSGIEGGALNLDCDTSVLLEDINGNKNHLIEKNAIPNMTFKGFNCVNIIKEELEKVCPGVVSCADILVLATRDGVLMVWSPSIWRYQLGLQWNSSSVHTTSIRSSPASMDAAAARSSLEWIGRCNSAHVFIFGWAGDTQSFPPMAIEFEAGRAGGLYYPVLMGRRDSDRSYFQRAMTEISKPDSNINKTLYLFGLRGFGERETVALLGFDSHYYQSLLRGRGLLLFADQQLMANEKTAEAVRDYAADAAFFRMDFARAMVKLSSLGVLTGSQGQVRLNCFLPVVSSKQNLQSKH
ncbi:peroxidase-like [Cornus florida]|uniref:peroxidase-like n=1 Tax=Cornus florida TaxID=4283 RepID=UPI0028964FF8|nr:peroxidase-like [Cornus florida]